MEKAFKVQDRMIVKGIMPSVITYSTLINCMCKLGSMEVARELYDHMLEMGSSPNYVTYIALIHGYMEEDNMQ